MTVSTEHIQITPGTCGGRPRIAGHRIRVQDIVGYQRHWGWSPEKIVQEFPQLTLADVHAALTYYYDHRAEIDRQIAEDDHYIREMEKLHPSPLDASLKKLGLTREQALEMIRRGDTISPR